MKIKSSWIGITIIIIIIKKERNEIQFNVFLLLCINYWNLIRVKCYNRFFFFVLNKCTTPHHNTTHNIDGQKLIQNKHLVCIVYKAIAVKKHFF